MSLLTAVRWPIYVNFYVSWSLVDVVFIYPYFLVLRYVCKFYRCRRLLKRLYGGMYLRLSRITSMDIPKQKCFDSNIRVISKHFTDFYVIYIICGCLLSNLSVVVLKIKKWFKIYIIRLKGKVYVINYYTDFFFVFTCWFCF